jgi:hypothetical protein
MADQFSTDLNAFSKSSKEVIAANAKSQGMTAEEYLASRGGVNPVTKKYGDSYNANIDLNDAEYQAAVGGAGSKIGDAGAALNAAREKKLQAYIAANPDSPEAMRYGKEARAEAKMNAAKTVSSVTKQSDGSSIVRYSDGTTTTLPAGAAVPAVGSSIAGTTSNTSASATKAAEDQAKRQSAYDLLYEEFNRYGLGSLVTPLKDLITSGVSPSEFTLRLRETDAYKKRFAANELRIKSGLRALSEFEYITKEDSYQEVMRRKGLPAEYYAKGDLGVQKGFESLLAGDVSSNELEDRIVNAQDRVLNANPEIAKTLKEFYPGISNGDILAYALDPANALNAIKRKITAAEIGVAAKQEGLTSGLTRAEELATLGVTQDTAEQGYRTIGGGLQRGSQLASMYGQDQYTQTTAEQEVFNLQGSQEARKQRQKITGLEQSEFGKKTGLSAGALARDRAGAY